MRLRTPLATLLNTIVLSSLAQGCGGSAADTESTYSGGSGGQGSGGKAGSGDTGYGGIGSGGTGYGGIGNGGYAGTIVTAGSGGQVGVPSTPVCNDDGTIRFTEGLNPTEPADYIGVYLNSGSGAPMLYASTGELCGNAMDPQACQTAFASTIPTMAGFPKQFFGTTAPPPFYSYLFLGLTRGDDVEFIIDHAGLLGFLGTVDTANEAALVFLTMGYGPTCTGVWETADAYFTTTPWTFMSCSLTPPQYSLRVTRSGETLASPLGMGMPCVGRRPSGLSPAEGCDEAGPLGRYYAELAYLEAAAVVAFEVMEEELEHFGAPVQLVERARRARLDEIRHARQMTELALQHGSFVPEIAVRRAERRSLLEMALENAVEGCVRETWGALSARWQAVSAGDARARRIWQQISIDEAEHAELSLALHDWLMSRLSKDEQRIVEEAAKQAIRDLGSQLETEPAPAPEVVASAGVPTQSQSRLLFGELESGLWSSPSQRPAPRAA